MKWTRFADKAPEPRQVVVVQPHGEYSPDGTPREIRPLEYFPPITKDNGERIGARWGRLTRATVTGWEWERIHPDDNWRPVTPATSTNEGGDDQ